LLLSSPLLHFLSRREIWYDHQKCHTTLWASCSGHSGLFVTLFQGLHGQYSVIIAHVYACIDGQVTPRSIASALLLLPVTDTATLAGKNEQFQRFGKVSNEDSATFSHIPTHSHTFSHILTHSHTFSYILTPVLFIFRAKLH